MEVLKRSSSPAFRVPREEVRSFWLNPQNLLGSFLISSIVWPLPRTRFFALHDKLSTASAEGAARTAGSASPRQRHERQRRRETVKQKWPCGLRVLGHPTQFPQLFSSISVSHPRPRSGPPPDLAAPAELELQGLSTTALLLDGDDVLKRCGVAPHKVREKQRRDTRRGSGGRRRLRCGLGQVTHGDKQSLLSTTSPPPFLCCGALARVCSSCLQPKLPSLAGPSRAASPTRLRDALNDLVKTL